MRLHALLPCLHHIPPWLFTLRVQALGIRKAALLFLTTGDLHLHHEQAWRLWFASAARLVPAPAAQVGLRESHSAAGARAPHTVRPCPAGLHRAAAPAYKPLHAVHPGHVWLPCRVRCAAPPPSSTRQSFRPAPPGRLPPASRQPQQRQLQQLQLAQRRRTRLRRLGGRPGLRGRWALQLRGTPSSSSACSASMCMRLPALQVS